MIKSISFIYIIVILVLILNLNSVSRDVHFLASIITLLTLPFINYKGDK